MFPSDICQVETPDTIKEVLKDNSLVPELNELLNESEELKKILGSICKKASAK